MPSRGLSLVGFLDEPSALGYLTNTCIPPDPAPPALLAAWQAAQAQRGAAIPGAGQPAVNPIPSAHDGHVQALQAAPLAVDFFNQGWALRTVEIDSLLAFQHHVDLDKCDALAAGLPMPLTLADVLPRCLPLNQPPMPSILMARQPADLQQMQSIVLKSPDLNIRILSKGFFQQINTAGTQVELNMAGVQLGLGSPFTLVVRFNGRCYLHNGFHRAYAYRMRGLPELPCFFREVAAFQDVAEGPPGTFGQALLESANPPTLGHFTQNRASPVQLRRISRNIHINWAEYVLPDE